MPFMDLWINPICQIMKGDQSIVKLKYFKLCSDVNHVLFMVTAHQSNGHYCSQARWALHDRPFHIFRASQSGDRRN